MKVYVVGTYWKRFDETLPMKPTTFFHTRKKIVFFRLEKSSSRAVSVEHVIDDLEFPLLFRVPLPGISSLGLSIILSPH